jgi:hypothetical protein
MSKGPNPSPPAGSPTNPTAPPSSGKSGRSENIILGVALTVIAGGGTTLAVAAHGTKRPLIILLAALLSATLLICAHIYDRKWVKHVKRFLNTVGVVLAVVMVIAWMTGLGSQTASEPTSPGSKPEPGPVGPTPPVVQTPVLTWSPWNPVNDDFKLDRGNRRVAVVSQSEKSIDVFAFRDGQIWNTNWSESDWNASEWSSWYPLPTNSEFARGARQITAIARPKTNEIDVFAVGDDNRVWWTWWQGRVWASWQPLPGEARFDPQTQAVAAVARSQFEMDLFAIDLIGGVKSSRWQWVIDRWGWTPWSDMPVAPHTFPKTQQVSAVARNDHTLDIFAIDDGAVWRTTLGDGPPWGQWEKLPAGPVFDSNYQQVAAVSRPMSNTLDVLGIDNLNRVASIHSDDGRSWQQAWVYQAPRNFDHVTQTVTALARSKRNIDVFALGSDGSTGDGGESWSNYWPDINNRWAVWFPTRTGGERFDVAQHNIAAVARSENNLDMFVVGLDGALYTASWSSRIP